MEDYIGLEQSKEEFNWHVNGLAQHIVDGIQGTDPLINFSSWEDIIREAAEQAIKLMEK